MDRIRFRKKQYITYGCFPDGRGKGSPGRPEHNKLDETKKDAVLSVYNEKKSRGRRQIKMMLSTKFDIHMSLGSVHRYMKILNLRSIMKKMPENKGKDDIKKRRSTKSEDIRQ